MIRLFRVVKRNVQVVGDVKVFVATCDATLNAMLFRNLVQRGYIVEQAPRTALWDMLRHHANAFVVCDLVAGEDFGMQMRHIGALVRGNEARYLVLSETMPTSQIIELTRAGLRDVIAPPYRFEQIVERIDDIISTSTMQQAATPAPVSGANANLVRSPAMASLLAIAQRVARSPSRCVLISGESGVGKEVLSSYIHAHSARVRQPFLKVNLAAVPETMVEAELFGSVKGAFTGAHRDREGFFTAADGGTLLLDEFCEFRFDLQSKLLRVLQDRSFYPVGGTREQTVDVRVIAATNRDPQQAVIEHLLREDLYYRVSTVHLHIPALRERREDISALTKNFVAEFAKEYGRPELEISDATLNLLSEHDWPGNVRELRNVLERAVLLGEGPILHADAIPLSTSQRGIAVGTGKIVVADALNQSVASRALASAELDRSVAPKMPNLARGTKPNLSAAEHAPAVALRVSTRSRSLTLEETRRVAVEEAEREHIVEVLAMTAGNQSKAAKLLGVSRTTLWEKMRRYGLRDPLSSDLKMDAADELTQPVLGETSETS